MPSTIRSPLSLSLRISIATSSTDAYFDRAERGAGVDRERLRRASVHGDPDRSDPRLERCRPARCGVGHVQRLVAEGIDDVDLEAGHEAGDIARSGEQQCRHDEPPRPTSHDADEEADAAHERRGAEPLLGVETATVELVDQRPAGGDDHGEPERRTPEYRGLPARSAGTGRSAFTDRSREQTRRATRRRSGSRSSSASTSGAPIVDADWRPSGGGSGRWAGRRCGRVVAWPPERERESDQECHHGDGSVEEVEVAVGDHESAHRSTRWRRRRSRPSPTRCGRARTARATTRGRSRCRRHPSGRARRTRYGPTGRRGRGDLRCGRRRRAPPDRTVPRRARSESAGSDRPVPLIPRRRRPRVLP